MRVLQLGKFYPPDRGGIETTTFELTEGLNRLGVHTDVVCCSRNLATQRMTAELGYTVARAGTLGRLVSVSLSPALLLEVARTIGQYDIVHLHMPDPMSALALWQMKHVEPRIVLHWHSDVVRQRLTLKMYEPLQNWLLDRSDAIIATSCAYADASTPLVRWREKVSVIPIGVRDPLASVNPLRVSEIKAAHGRGRIVMALGRVEAYKGFDVLIDAARHLPDDTRVLIAGSGRRSADLARQIARWGLQERVVLLGALSPQDVVDHLAAADVFCLPSLTRAEAFGVAMVEAMAMARPIVATEVAGSGVPWINQHGVTGFNVQVGSALALKDAMLQLLNDAELAKRFGVAARLRYVERFMAERMLADTVRLYERLIAS